MSNCASFVGQACGAGGTATGLLKDVAVAPENQSSLGGLNLYKRCRPVSGAAVRFL